jgi:hypothetical protein
VGTALDAGRRPLHGIAGYLAPGRPQQLTPPFVIPMWRAYPPQAPAKETAQNNCKWFLKNKKWGWMSNIKTKMAAVRPFLVPAVLFFRSYCVCLFVPLPVRRQKIGKTIIPQITSNFKTHGRHDPSLWRNDDVPLRHSNQRIGVPHVGVR